MACRCAAQANIQIISELFANRPPWFSEHQKSFYNIVFGSLPDLPGEATREKALLQEIGIQAMVALPLRGVTNPIGWIGFSFAAPQQKFTQIKIRLFAFISDAVTRALVHQHKMSVSREQEIFLSTVLNTVSDAVFVLDRSGKIMSVNRTATQITGYPPEKLLERKVTDLFVPASSPTASIKANGLVYVNRPDGKKIWATVTYNNLVGTNQQVTGKACTFHDITKEMKGWQLLDHNEPKYRSVIGSMELGLLEISANGFITNALPAFCNLIGYEVG